MANQIIVTKDHSVQVSVQPTPQVQVSYSRGAITTITNVPTANFANYAANVTASNQPNITNVGTLGNLSVTGTVTSGNVSTPTVYNNGMQMQGYDYVQMQYSNAVTLPVSPYDIGVGSWFYLDAGGAVWQSNTTGTIKTVILGNDGTINANGNVSAPYYIGNGSQLTGIVATGGNANYANFAGNVTGANQPNITNVGTLGNLVVSSNATIGNLTVIGNLQVGNLFANNANYANFAGEAFNVNAANITGTVANSNYSAYAGQANNANLATFATTANAVAGANVSGEVANANFASYSEQANTANLATYATTANAVAGANVSGEVANANFASYANLATTANSVNVANVVGIGNIATTNYDGNASNVLYGNGGFYALPTISNVANANYANFAGQVVDNTQSNITALGTLANLSVTGNIDTQNNVTALKYYAATGGDEFSGYGFVGASNSNTAMCMTSTDEITFYNNAIETLSLYANNDAKFYANLQANYYFGDGSQLSNINGGNVSNVANANYANFAGTAYSVDGANVSGTVANANFAAYSEQANNANLATYATTANAVAGANVSGVVANANYASYANIANTANSVNVANVVGIGNIATTNYDGNSGNILYGNGGFYALPVISNVANANYANYAGQANTANLATFATTANAVAGANVSGQVANALVAGTVYTNAQPNITSHGNLINLNVTGNTTTSTSFQFVPNGINVGTTSTNAASFVITDYGLQPGTSNGQPLTYQFVKSRGNSGTPVASSNNDQTIRFATNYFNGNTYPRNFLFNVLATQAANANFAGSNVAWGPGSFFLNTGHPFGNVTSNTATSSQNSLGFNQFGTLQITPGTYSNGNGTVGTSVLITSYGANTDGAGQSGQIQMNRARGNRDSLVAVANTDGVGAIRFNAYSGNSYNTVAGIFANVNTTTGAIANGSVVPIDISLVVSANAGNTFTTTFAASGNVTFPTGKTVTASYFSGDGSNLTNIFGNISNNATGGRLALNTTSAGTPQLNLNGDSTVNSKIQIYNGQFSSLLDGVNPTTGFSSIILSQYSNAYNATSPMRFFRSRGNLTTPLSVTANTEVGDINFGVYADSGNTFYTVGDLKYTIASNDGAGNVTVNALLSGPASIGVGSTLTLGFQDTVANNISGSGNISGANVSINTNGFMKLASYTASALTAITGQIGWMAAVSDSGGGGNPNGMIAFWDTSNSRWSYIHDNHAV